MVGVLLKEKQGIRKPGLFELSWRRIGLACELIYDGSDSDSHWPWMLHVHVLWLNLFLHFPCKIVPKSRREAWRREWQQWGFSQTDDAIHLHWNECGKVWFMPWFNKVFQRHEVRREDGSWVPYVGTYEHDKKPDGRELFTFPYTYTLKCGEVQNRTATVYVDRMAWRPKWFTWTRLFEKERQSISVEFDDEVGERSGSWKGGCVGCGWTMLPGESAEQTLRRMESERIFA
jgi:hypothetical protein